MSFQYVMLCLAVTALAYTSALKSTSGSVEQELRRYLFSNYDKHTRPVKQYSTAVTVNISLSPLSVNDLNENRQVITMDTWVKMTWMDENLKWNPEDYDNIKMLRVSASEVWRPDISLYTGTPDTALFPKVQTNVIVLSSGKIFWVPPFTMSSRCPPPYQSTFTASKSFIECNLKMGSWTYNEQLLDLQLETDTVDLSDFIDTNYDWKFVKVDSNRESKIYPCCPDESYPSVNFNVTLKRRNNA